jgi:hypothetical protein
MKFKLTLLTAIALLTVVATARAQEHQPSLPKGAVIGMPVRLGDKVILIPEPEGFEEATSQFESFKARTETTEAPQNDVLAAHLPAGDCELLRKGSTLTYNFFTKVSVMKTVRELPISPAEMAAGVDDYRKHVGAYLDPDGPMLKELEKRIEAGLTRLDAKETKIDFGKPQQLGEFEIRPDLNSFLMLITLKSNSGGTEQTIPMLATTSFVRVKERVIFVYCFMKYGSQADIDKIKKFATKWTNSILEANR